MLYSSTSALKQFAASYGADVYGCGAYEQGGTCQTTTGGGSPLAPLTGFFEQPAYIVLPTLLLIAVLLGSLTFLIARKFKRR